MVFALIGEMWFSTAARRDTVLSNTQQYLVNHPAQWDVTTLSSVTAKTGDPAIFFTVRFLAQADRDQMITDLQGFAVGARAPIAGSWVEPHTCDHDEVSIEACTPDARVVWV